MFGVDLAEMTGANSGCLLCPVGHPCIGGCRRSGGHSPSRCVAVLVWSSSIEMCRHARCRSCRDDRSQQRLSAVLVGSSLHREVSPCMVGHPPSVGVAIPGVIFAEMTGANSGCLLCPVGHPCIGGCRRSRWVIPAACCARWVIPPSRCVAMLGVDLAEMTGANSGCLLCPVGHPCIGGCRRSCLVILHRWVSPFPVLSLRR